ncbi:hypothetical protein PVK06_034587 [Gossypium arboreum]|uniref:RNase H type-1 domain-containing protein n=1 Tax=Gossypium arboreum TaxID=29729 RepID=A0ABR0NGS1_GOSAR|nr:hypothetical protein PVK06_034587 [Gossypium arboreum]
MLEFGHASSSGVIRDDTRQWRMGFSRKIGICPIVEAELWGAYDGLRQAWSMGIRNVVLKMDN